MAAGLVAHVAGIKDARYTNARAVTLRKPAVSMKKGGTFAIKASVVLLDQDRKSLPRTHAPVLRYKSSDESVATVSRNGVIKGIKAGKCKIYVTAINGLTRKVSVTVKSQL